MDAERMMPQGLGLHDSDSLQSEAGLRVFCKTLTTTVSAVEQEVDGVSGPAKLNSLIHTLLETASSTHLSWSHGAAAINALCGLLDRCCASSVAEVKGVALSKLVWETTFDIFLTKHECHKPKPVRRLLDTSIKLATEQRNDESRRPLIERAMTVCLHAIFAQEETVSIKAALQALDIFLRRQLTEAESIVRTVRFFLEDIMHDLEDISDFGAEPDNQRRYVAQIIILQSLTWVQYPDCAPAVSRFLAAFIQDVEKAAATANDQPDRVSTACLPPVWGSPLTYFHHSHPELFDVLEKHVYPLLLDQEGLSTFLLMLTRGSLQEQEQDPDSLSEVDLHMYLLAARVVRKSEDISRELISTRSTMEASGLFDPIQLSLELLDHASSSIRLSALSLLLDGECLSLLPDDAVIRLIECIPYFHQETSPKPRNEFIALMRKFYSKLRNVSVPETNTQVWQSPFLKGLTASKAPHRLREWYFEFLTKELRPTGTYFGHVTALSVLRIIFEDFHRTDKIYVSLRALQTSFKDPEALYETLTRALLDLLFDPFDDVRELAHALLDLLLTSEMSTGLLRSSDATGPFDSSRPTALGQILAAFGNARNLFQRTGRACHAEGLARLLSLNFGARTVACSPYDQHWAFQLVEANLEEDIRLATDDLSKAVDSAPLHGNLIAMRFYLTRSRLGSMSSNIEYIASLAFSSQVLKFCTDIWYFVRPILCADAPEGMLLTDEVSETQDEEGKEKLSFCWRALKEASVLIDATIARYANAINSSSAHDNGIYVKLGHLIFQQLAELRHRGAFSTVSQTWAAWCTACNDFDDPGIAELPQLFYKEALAYIQEKATTLTRRSAGLPSIITGILVAHYNDKFFDEALLDLQAIADAPLEQLERIDRLELPQVHALNCLKDVVTDSRFGPRTEPHIDDLLFLGAECLDSQVWAIRNSGLMLIKALLSRINGGTSVLSRSKPSSSRPASKVTYSKFANLSDIIMRLLYTSTASQWGDHVLHAQRVFPALEIVERFGVPQKHQSEIMKALHYYISSPLWAVREKVAKPLASITPMREMYNKVQQAFAKKSSCQNEMHGKLLYVRRLITRILTYSRRSAQKYFVNILSCLGDAFDRIALVQCPVTTAAFLDIIADVAEYCNRDEHPVTASHRQNIEAFFRTSSRNLNVVSLLTLKSVAKEAKGLSEQSILRCQNALATQLATCKTLDTVERESTIVSAMPSDAEEHKYQLQMLGQSVAAKYLRSPTSRQTLMELTSWMRYVLSSVSETRARSEVASYSKTFVHIQDDVSIRMAAIKSICHFFSTVTKVSMVLIGKPELIPLCTLLYDTVLDDDEDVRSEAARAVSVILNHSEHHVPGTLPDSLSPAAARYRFIDFIFEHHYKDPRLLVEAAVRMRGGLIDRHWAQVDIRFPPPESDDPIKDYSSRSDGRSFFETAAQDTINDSWALFEVEKRNLYIDEAVEAEMWRNMLLKVALRVDLETPSHYKYDGLSNSICLWSARATHQMVDIFTYPDGILGPMSNSGAFLPLHYALLATKARVYFQTNRCSDPTLSNLTCLNRLRKLRKLGQNANLHGLLLHELDELIKVLQTVCVG